VAGTALWIAAPVAGVVWALSASTQQSLVERQTELWVTAKPAADTVSHEAAVQLLWEPSAVARAPSWSGLVLRVFAAPGNELVSGSAVVDIDGITRRAYSTPEPFHRPLVQDAVGPDVLALNTILAPYGAPAGSDRFGWATLRALRSFAAEIGVPAPSKVSSFDPSWVIHLSADEPVVVGAIDLQQGETAPTAGSVILQGVTTLTGARLVTTAIEVTNDPLTRTAFVEGSDPLALAPSEDETVAYRDSELGVTDDGWLSPESMSALGGEIIGHPASVAVVLTRASVTGDQVIPAAALSAGSGNAVCGGEADKPRVIQVEVVSGSAGQVVVRGLEPDALVRIPSPGVAPCK